MITVAAGYSITSHCCHSPKTGDRNVRAMLLDDLGSDQGALSSTTQAFDMDDGITNLSKRG